MSNEDVFVEGKDLGEAVPEPKVIEECDIQMSREDALHNFKVCILLDSIWEVGWTDFMMALQPILMFLALQIHVKDPNFWIGMVTSLSLFLVPGLYLSPYITRRFPFKKLYNISANVPYLFPIGVMGFVVIFSHRWGMSYRALWIFIFAATALHRFFAGFCALPHNEYVAACIPAHLRGRFTGYSLAFGSAVGFGSAILGKWIIKVVPMPMSYGWLFLLTWIICQGGYIVALFAREKRTPVEKSPAPWSKMMLQAAWQDRPFMNFMLIVAIYEFLLGGVFAFIATYAYADFRHFGLNCLDDPIIRSWTAFFLVTVPLGMRVLLGPVLGILTDMIKSHRMLPIAMLVNGCALLPLVFFRDLHMARIAVFASIGIFTAGSLGYTAAYTAMMFNLVAPHNRAGHFTLKLFQFYLCMSLGAPLTGWVIDKFHYIPVFAVSGIGIVFLSILATYKFKIINDSANG
jgi:MFS family permease